VTDEALVELARRGDTSAFGELVTRHQAAVYRTAMVVCRDRSEAEDVAQETFLAAWQRLEGFRGEARFLTWILRIAWHRALTRRESTWTRLRRVVTDVAGAAEPASPAPSAEARLADSEFAGVVHDLVRQLPPRLRDPLLLAAAGDCTFEEMASLLGVPSGTLKWRVSDARRRLKRQLSARGYEWT
jgi:RNA polymerase sigma-70 factor, ECF subfamily